jgi:hypothetical protein
MFGDCGWKPDMSQSIRWDLWQESVLDLCGKEALDLKVCIMEIGCGLTVPTCRWTSEGMMEDVLSKGGDATLIRINLDFPLAERAPGGSVENNVISIASRGLVALRQIGEFYSSCINDDQ